jgi:hypothetical protein
MPDEPLDQADVINIVTQHCEILLKYFKTKLSESDYKGLRDHVFDIERAVESLNDIEDSFKIGVWDIAKDIEMFAEDVMDALSDAENHIRDLKNALEKIPAG